MTIGTTSALPALSGNAAAPATETEKIRKAAGQFEALFLAQLLRSARESATPEDSSGQSGGSMMEIAEEHIAQALADSGGLGLSQAITESFGKLDVKPPVRQLTAPS